VADGALYQSMHAKLRTEQQQADEAAARDRRALHAAIFANTAPADAQWELPPLADEEDDDGTAPHNGLNAPVRALRLLLAVRTAEEEQRAEQWVSPEQEEEERAAALLPRTDAATVTALLDQLETDAAALSESHSTFLQLQRTQAERELIAHRKRLRLLPSLMHPSLSFAPGSPTFHAARSPLGPAGLHSPTSPWRV
jgi:hypothetical protein